MSHTKQHIVDEFFNAYGKRDMAGLRMVMHDNVTWYFKGRYPYAGVKHGIDEVIQVKP